MARNGSGTFVRAHDFTDDAAAAIKIRADRMDEEIDGIATALSASIANDGQTTIQADLPMSTYKHTGVGNATARDQYATVASLQDGSHNWVAAGGTADAITATYAPALTALVDGQLCFVRAGAANATTTPTFAPNGLTARTITRSGGGALAVGDIKANAELTLRYNLANTRWELAATAGLSTRQILTSGTGATYNTPAGVRQLRIRIVGGGGGGAADSGSGGTGGPGGTSSFNGITAVGGGGGNSNGNAGAGGTGGSNTPTSGSVAGLFRTNGTAGGPGANATAATAALGGTGGASIFGGGTSNSNAAQANSGAGGSGKGISGGALFSGGGGGAGEGVEFIINSPAASYTYTIGTGGTADPGAGAGGSGRIIVDELY